MFADRTCAAAAWFCAAMRPPAKHVLAEAQAGRPLIGRAETRLAQVEAAAARRLGGVRLRRARGESRKLRLECFCIAGAGVELRQILTSRLVLLPGGTNDTGPRDLDRLALRLRDAERLVQRELDWRRGTSGGRRLLRAGGGDDRGQRHECQPQRGNDAGHRRQRYARLSANGEKSHDEWWRGGNESFGESISHPRRSERRVRGAPSIRPRARA
jgi:hypothetical protein